MSARQALKFEEDIGRPMNWSDGEATGAPAPNSPERQLITELELAVDAKSVFSAVEAKETKTPAEASLLSSVQCMRELLDNKRLRRMWWIDTRDMISDGLNKGSVDRKAIIGVLQHNIWSQIGDDPCSLDCYESLAVPGLRSCAGLITQIYDSKDAVVYATNEKQTCYEQKNGYATILRTCVLSSIAGFVV